MPEDEIADIELIGLVEGTVDDLKQYIRENDPGQKQLEKILRAEKDAKDRKTAKRFLKGSIEQKDDSEASGKENDVEEDKVENEDSDTEDIEEKQNLKVEDEEIDREQLLKILGGTVEEMKDYIREKDPSDRQLQEILHAEKVVNDRKTAVSFLKSYSKREELKDDIRKAEHDFQELREDLTRIEDEVLDEDIDLSGVEMEDIEEKAETENDTEEESEDEETDSQEKEETGEEASEEEPDEESGSDDDDENDTEEPDELTKEDRLEEKREIAEKLETDLSDEDLKDIPLEELKSIRDDKMEREELIEALSDEFEEEKLRNASTEDLKKLMDDIEDTEEEDESPEKESEEIKEEAQEDLEMLMGAVKAKDRSESESKDRLSGLKDLRSNIRDKLDFRGGDEEEEDDNGMPKDEVIELLEDYQELEKYESAIKTAHIMKGFLEYSEGIDRELTYRELNEEIKASSDEMETLLEFFSDMQKDQYTGDITADMEEVIDSARKVVNRRG